MHKTPPPAEADQTDIKALNYLLDAAMQEELRAVQEWALASSDPANPPEVVQEAARRMEGASAAVAALRNELDGSHA